MATTGTTTYSPSTGNLVLSAYARLQMRRTELTQQHLEDALQEANFLQVEFINRQPNLWTSELLQIPLVAGTATYNLPASLICFMAVYITTSGGGGGAIDRICAPLSTYEYSALPNKTVESFPNQYWFNRQITPQITMWPVPDNSQTYTLNMQYLRQLDDAGLASGTTPQIPYRWIDAFVAGLASRLAQIYKPEMSTILDAKAERSWQIAAKEDTEDVPLYVMPGLNWYST